MNQDNALDSILNFLKTNRCMDCSGYRLSMIQRRVNHRLFKAGSRDLMEYFHLIQKNPDELDSLVDALTINVTRFFRDSLVFEYLADKTLPAILAEKGRLGQGSLRVWSSGCASGEEPYSIAILITEMFKKEKKTLPLFIFGTDISKKALQKAGQGVYDFETIKNMKYRHVKEYLIEQGNQLYRITPETRELVSFSLYNLLDEESFAPSESIYGNFDLVLCRNVLIYFGPNTQDIIFSKLYRSLAPGGYLVLGETETPSQIFQGRFQKVTDSCHVYQKVAWNF